MKYFGMAIIIYFCLACHVSKGVFVPPRVSVLEEGRKQQLSNTVTMQDLKVTMMDKVLEKIAFTDHLNPFHRRRHQKHCRLNRMAK